MTTPADRTAKVGVFLGSAQESFAVRTSMDVTPGAMGTTGQDNLDLFVKVIQNFAQAIALKVTLADGSADGLVNKITFTVEHVGAVDAARLEAALVAAGVAAAAVEVVAL